MSKRLFFLSDGTLKSVSAGRFRGDDAVTTRTITEQIVVDNQGVQGQGAPVHMDPTNPDGPLVIHYNSATGQQGLKVVDETTGTAMIEIANDGKLISRGGIAADSVSGDAFDKGDWVAESSSEPVPQNDTVVTRDAALEVVNVSNLRVGMKTTNKKKYVDVMWTARLPGSRL